jgi:hypothetical protein
VPNKECGEKHKLFNKRFLKNKQNIETRLLPLTHMKKCSKSIKDLNVKLKTTAEKHRENLKIQA